MTKLKKDGTPKKSGGARFKTHSKSRLAKPEVQADWKRELKRAICVAASNSTILRKNSFFTLREIQRAYGKAAVAEFKSWFEATKLFDQVEGDRLYQEWKSGLLEESLYKRFLHTRAVSWSWSIRPEKQQRAWRISRGIEDL